MSEDLSASPKPDPGALRLRKKEPEQPEQNAKQAPPVKRASKRPPKPKRKKRTGPSRVRYLIQSFGAGTLVLTAFGLFIAHQVLEWEFISSDDALLARNITLAVFFVLLILESFFEDLMQGILCLFLLPYTFFFGIFITHSGALRGITIAIILFLGAEMYFTPEQAVVPEVQKQVNGWITAGQDKLIYPDGRPQAGFEE